MNGQFSLFDEPDEPEETPQTPQTPYRFDGADYVPARDDAPLTTQYDRIFALMRDGIWRTYSEIAAYLGYPEGSISAQLRHMKKKRFGAHTVNRRIRSGRLSEYQLIVATTTS